MTTPRSNIESEIRTRAQRDPDYRSRLLADPRAALSTDHGVDVPPALTIRVVEEAPDEVVLVLPPARSATPNLADSELELSGAGWDWTDSCTCGCP